MINFATSFLKTIVFKMRVFSMALQIKGKVFNTARFPRGNTFRFTPLELEHLELYKSIMSNILGLNDGSMNVSLFDVPALFGKGGWEKDLSFQSQPIYSIQQSKVSFMPVKVPAISDQVFKSVVSRALLIFFFGPLEATHTESVF